MADQTSEGGWLYSSDWSFDSEFSSVDSTMLGGLSADLALRSTQRVESTDDVIQIRYALAEENVSPGIYLVPVTVRDIFGLTYEFHVAVEIE